MKMLFKRETIHRSILRIYVLCINLDKCPRVEPQLVSHWLCSSTKLRHLQ